MVIYFNLIKRSSRGYTEETESKIQDFVSQKVCCGKIITGNGYIFLHNRQYILILSPHIVTGGMGGGNNVFSFQFYRSHDLMIRANNPLVKLLENSLLFCVRYASLEQGLFCYHKCSELLNDYDLDTSSSWVLTQLKCKECYTLPFFDQDLDFVIKINRLAQLIFPRNSLRRYFLCFILRKMRRLAFYRE